MKELEALKNVTINLDFATAERITSSYITYKYVDTVCALFLAAILCLFVYKLIKYAVDKS